MTAPRWTVTNDQFLSLDGEPIAMALTPAWAIILTSMLNAQDQGTVHAEAEFDQRLADVQTEFGMQIASLERQLKSLRAAR